MSVAEASSRVRKAPKSSILQKVCRREAMTLRPFKSMKLCRCSTLSFAIAFVLASCGEPERPKPSVAATHPARAHGEFDEVGTVTLYPGESCASQVVFIFHNGSKSISLAAPWL